MVTDNRLITAPISMTDIATVIGETTDLNRSSKINYLSKYKPTNAKDRFTTASSHQGDGTSDGFFLGYDCYGVTKPYMINTQFIQLGPNGTPTGNPSKLVNVDFANIEGSWGRSAISVSRMADWNNYTHQPKNNSMTNSSTPFVTICQCTNPNGAIAGSATIRYNWDDIVHEDGKSATLGLKSLLACDGVNTNAYLGVAVYRTLDTTPETGKVLVDIGVAKIHTAPLGTTCPNTGEIYTHNVAFEMDDLIVGSAGSVTDGYTNFYYGEVGVKAIPFIAKWDGTTWCLIGLGVTPASMPGALVSSGGSGSITNNVAITNIVCRLRAVQESSAIRFGIASNTDFAITTSGSGMLAFPNGNTFYITPADGNSIMQSQLGVRLGISYDDTLDMPYTQVSAGTYYASSLMYGRTSGASYTSAPTSTFKSYAGTAKFKVGITVPYYYNLKKWVYLSGSVEIDPANLQDYYTITINA